MSDTVVPAEPSSAAVGSRQPRAQAPAAPGSSPPGTFVLASEASPVRQGMRVLILGGGPAGYEAALVAAQLGAEVRLVEERGWVAARC